MKIEALNLIAFGPFANKVLDFSGNGYGLNVVYGANEAGKSTALRALQGLFYGFPHKIEDAWLHDYNKLAVGGTLSLTDAGGLLNLTRYKRRKNDLINDDTGQPFDQTELDKILGRMGREAFEHAFGISHYSLRQGVESVLAAGGDLGHALFAATSGLNTLKRVMAELDNLQNQLFAPRAKKANINAGIEELNKVRKNQREVSASHVQWKKMKKLLDDLQKSEIEGSQYIEALASKISLLSRQKSALKFVVSRDQLEKDIIALGFVPDLPDGFSERRVETQVAIKQSRQAEKNLQLELAEIDKKLKNLTYDKNIMANEKLITALADEANIHIQASKDSKGIRARIYQHKESAQQALDLLRPGLKLDSIGNLMLSKPEKGKIQRLGAKGAKLDESVVNAGKVLNAAKANLDKSKVELDKLEKPKDTSALNDCLSRAAEYGKLEERLAEARAGLKVLKEQADADLAALGLWTGTISDLERLAIPTDETMRSYENNLTEVEQKIADIEKEKGKLHDQLNDKEITLSELTQTRDIPSIRDLKSHRDLRDKGWQSVRVVWLEQGNADQDFLAAFSGSIDLAQAYEKSILQADHTSDVLRVDAEIVARADALRVDIQNLKKSFGEIQKIVDACNKDRIALWNRWVNLWKQLSIEPLTPREMTAWAGKVGELRRKASDLRERRITVDQLLKDIDRINVDIKINLENVGVNASDKISYSAIIELAKRTFKSHDQLHQNRLDLEIRIKALREEIDTCNQRQIEAKQNLQDWSEGWALAISKLGFSNDSPPEDVNDFILAIDDVIAEMEKINEKQGRVNAINSNRIAYGKQVADALANLAPELKDLEPEAVAIELNARLTGDKEKRNQYRLLSDEKRKKSSAISHEKEKLAALEETLRLLCLDAQTDNADRLPEIEKRFAAKTKLIVELSNVNDRLTELASGQDLNEFVDQVKLHDPDELAAKLDRLEAEKQELTKKQKFIVQEIALAAKELSSIGGESLAASIAEEAEGIVSRIQSDVEHYIKLRLASSILTNAIERYRQLNQSPILSAASEYFKTMTRDSFAGLRADFDDKGDPVIKAIRPDGTLLSVHEMSDGSRDQLFLALRLGGLAKYVNANGPMPFIVDDVLVHFDDERSAATLYAMSSLADKTQIIFFTHHQHLVDLAKKQVPGEILYIHSL